MAVPTDVSIEVSGTEGAAPFAVAVTPHATDTDATTPVFTIDFGDGSTTTGDAEAAIPHIYASPGQYTLTATAAVEGFDSADAAPVIFTVTSADRYPALQNPGGVCVPWVGLDDLCTIADTSSAETKGLKAINAATRWLNDMTGGRWGGPCTTFLRPNVGDTTGMCDPLGWNRRGRQPIDLSLWVTMPIVEVIELRVDGVVVPRKWYYVRGGKLHASTGWEDDDSPLIPWPVQNEDRQDGAVDTWDLTVLHGSGPPEPLLDAAAVLACEILKLVTNDETCALPKTAVSISRDGMTMTFQPPRPGRSGITFVDTQIDLYGPNGIGATPARMLDPADPTRVQVSRY